MSGPKDPHGPPAEPEVDRRTLLSGTASIAMIGGLAAGYGAFAAICGRYLYPAGAAARQWVFVSELARLPAAGALSFRTPAGARVTIARKGEGEQGLVALSSTCPHLGCQVHWEADKQRFFCPCHNGAFDPSGRATEGPPAEAGQSLVQYPVKAKDGLLFIELPDSALKELA